MSKAKRMKAATVGAVLINYVWPFFIKHIWPRIQEQVTIILTSAITSVAEQFRAVIGKRTQFRQQEAQVRAEEAEHRALETHNHVDSARYQAEAAVWRQVAEGLRHDNERLQTELTAALHTAIQQAAHQMKDVTLEVAREQVHLKTGDTTIALPSPSQDE